MKGVWLVAALAVAAVPAAGSDATQHRDYIGLAHLAGLGYVDVLAGGLLLCEGLPTGETVGGACFEVPAGARWMRTDAHDLGGRVWLVLWFMDAAGEHLDTEDTCPGGTRAVPGGAARVAVLVFPGGGQCGAGYPILGTLWASLW